MKSQTPIMWQQIPSAVTYGIGILTVLASVFGTAYVNQYRMDSIEATQRVSAEKIDRLDRSVLVIATKLGIPDRDLQVSIPKDSNISFFLPEKNANFSESKTNEPSATPAPIGTPEPTQSPMNIQVIKNVIDDLKGAL